MFQLINDSANIAIAGIPDLATAYYEFNELVACTGDLPGETIIMNTYTGEVIDIIR